MFSLLFFTVKLNQYERCSITTVTHDNPKEREKKKKRKEKERKER